VINSIIGYGIADLRKQKDMEQSELAEIIGVSQPVISRLERGEAQWTVKRFLKVCSAFEIDTITFQLNGKDIFTLINH